ncbi:MAG: methyltransferase [Thermoanaerobaculia bacterium]|nr:methyltransferase [Thermoanaerobaculia bacterium]
MNPSVPPDTTDGRRFRGWARPGPVPPGGVEPSEGETLDYIAGHFRIFQLARGHRFSTDDVLTAWYGTQCAPRVDRAADLGSGIGSVAMIVAWRLPGARMVTVEAQPVSIGLARKSVAYNGLADRYRLLEGDLRDSALFEAEPPFDLVTGSPPYFPEGTASKAAHPQAVPARVEMRGTVVDYAATAARILAPGGIFAFVFPFAQLERAEDALRASALVALRRRDVVFKEGERPMLSLFAAARIADLPAAFGAGGSWQPVVEPPLTIRTASGMIHAEYATIRMNFGFPPGELWAE